MPESHLVLIACLNKKDYKTGFKKAQISEHMFSGSCLHSLGAATDTLVFGSWDKQ